MRFEEFCNLYNSIMHTKKKDMTYYFNKIPVNERKEFLRFLYKKSVDEYLDFIDDIRDIAVQDFWTYERELIKRGESTRDWMPEQIESIYNISDETGAMRETGGAAIFLDIDGQTVGKQHGTEIVADVYEAHQMLSVNEYPEYAGMYRNMQALARNNGEHVGAHKGNYNNSTCWYFECEDASYHMISKGLL